MVRPRTSIEARLRQYEWIGNRQRDAERHISELLTVLLLSNSFLVAGFAAGFAFRKESKVAGYVFGVIAIAFCVLVAAVTWRYQSVATKRGRKAADVYKRLESDGVVSPGIYMSTDRKQPIPRWLPERVRVVVAELLSSKSVGYFWAPALFLILWITLVIFAI